MKGKLKPIDGSSTPAIARKVQQVDCKGPQPMNCYLTAENERRCIELLNSRLSKNLMSQSSSVDAISFASFAVYFHSAQLHLGTHVAKKGPSRIFYHKKPPRLVKKTLDQSLSAYRIYLNLSFF